MIKTVVEAVPDKFPCDGCGLCCKAINCSYLTKDNKCSIYDQRPLMCNVDAGYDALFKHTMTKKKYYMLNIEICDSLKQKEGK